MVFNLLLLESQDRICFQVAHINVVSFGLDLGMFPDQQPSDVGEEEASGRVVGVSISFRVLVVHTVITGPVYDGILEQAMRI